VHTNRRRLALHALLGLTAVVVMLAACGSAANTGPGATPRELDGTTWRAIQLRDVAPIAGAEPTIRFAGDQAGGTTGCNTYGGGYTLADDGTFRIVSMFMTEMGCPDGRATQETVVIETLADADRLEFLADGSIRISGPSGALIFVEDPR